MTRGRFDIYRADSREWVLTDRNGLCVTFETRREALAAKSFAIAYVKKHGNINLASFPFSLDDPFDPARLEQDTAHL